MKLITPTFRPIQHMETRSLQDKRLRPRASLTRRATGLRFRSVAFKRILVPLDFSANSKKALHCAVMLARKVDASLTLLHVVEPNVSQADFGYGYVTTRSTSQCVLKHAQRALNSLARKSQNSGPEPLAFVRAGVTETEIIQAATDLAADLIVIGSHGQSGSSIPIGTAEKVVRNAPCPVLVVRRKQSQSARSPKRGAL